jgi:hypothetical protein
MPTKRDAKDMKDTKGKSVVAGKPVAAKDNEAADNGLDKLKSVLEQRRMEKQQRDDVADKPAEPPPVSLGPAGAIVDALINTSPEKLLELTDFDRNQVSLVPQVVVIDDMWDYMEQVAMYRMDREHFFRTFKRKAPEIPATSRKFVHVLAQTRRSLGGKMKKALEDMALAELETKSMDEGAGVGGHDFED